MAHAGVDDDAEGEREVLVRADGVEGLGTIVDLEDEAVLGEVLEQVSVLVADDGGEIYDEGVGGGGVGGGSGGVCGGGFGAYWPEEHATRDPGRGSAAARARSAAKEAARDMVRRVIP